MHGLRPALDRAPRRRRARAHLIVADSARRRLRPTDLIPLTRQTAGEGQRLAREVLHTAALLLKLYVDGVDSDEDEDTPTAQRWVDGGACQVLFSLSTAF